MLVHSKTEGLISLNKKQFKKEEKLFEAILSPKTLTGVWTGGQFDDAPLSFKNTDIVINWSLAETKVEFFVNKDEKLTFLPFYFYTLYFGEWGDLEEKPIIFMEVETPNKVVKSKSPFKFRELMKFLENNIKLTIYFETVLLGDPENKSSWESNNDWISHVGGLYNIIDLAYWVENNKTDLVGDKSEPTFDSAEKYIKDTWLLSNNKLLSVETYESNLKIKEFAYETLNTALEMKKAGLGWKKFASPFI